MDINSVDINSSWKLQHFDVGQVDDLVVADPKYVDHFWMTTKVPGDVHSTLIERNLIPHPFFGHNDQACRWVEEKVWWYRTEFFWDQELSAGERMEFTFEGLDTYATVYLNGRELAFSDNMFVPLTLDVTRELTRGKNILAVKFDPISTHVKNKERNLWSGFSFERPWVRKAQMNFGWDWGPRLVTAGIWKPVTLQKRKLAKWDSVFAKTVNASDQAALVEVELSAHTFRTRRTTYGAKASEERANGNGMQKLTARIQLADSETKLEQTVELAHGHAVAQIHVDSPKLWWTADLGTPHLYELAVELLADGDVIDVYRCAFGIRTVEVVQETCHGENAFTFVLNGHRIFAKGADWIPVDCFFASVPASRYQHLITLSREAGMNMLRVWGGGIYEKPVFYEECDKQGILVWQDFMFACALYPDYHANFMENVEREITHVVKELRNHPCLALWCGNNENDWIYESMLSSGTIDTPFYGEKIYHEMMPDLLEQLDNTRLYWPSSPYGGNDHNDANEGDRHNWQVWHGHVYPRRFGEPERIDYSVEGVSFKNFTSCLSTFVSEFGMHAASNRYTLERWIPAGEFFWGSTELSYRNKDYHHQKGILLMEGYTGIPKDLDEYLNFSMLTQAEGLKFGIEHYRRRKFRSSGALFWQLNDCWPGTSWSVIDYHLLPKAAYFYAKKFFSPVLVSTAMDETGNVAVWVTNDTLRDYRDTIVVELLDFRGSVLSSEEYRVSVPANDSACIASLLESDLLRPHSDGQGQGTEGSGASVASTACHRPEEGVLRVRSNSSNEIRNLYYLRDHKDISWPQASLQVTVDTANSTVTIATNVHARMVKLEFSQPHVHLSDNFFDLIAGETITVDVGHLDGEKVNFTSLKVSAINAPFAENSFVENSFVENSFVENSFVENSWTEGGRR